MNRPARPTRRRFLKAAIVTGALVATGSVVAFVRTRGYELAPGRKLVLLAPWQFVFLEHAARRITAPDRPGDPSIPTADDVDVAGFLDTYLARMPPRLQKDLLRFVAYAEHLAPIPAGFGSRFTRLAPSDQDRVLSSIEAGSSDLLRCGFEGLKSLVFMGYYRDARTWKILGYDGPLVGRPTGGW